MVVLARSKPSELGRVTTKLLRLVSSESQTFIEETRSPSASELAASIRSGTCPDDHSFDRFLPYDLQIVSREHWTPLCVSMRVARWLEELGIRSVVDLGSGSGKFCVATALASQCEFIGVEQRAHLIDAAEDLADVFGVRDQVRFVHATLGEALVPQADAYYLFNPFGENVTEAFGRVDDRVELSVERYKRDIATMTGFLDELPVGAYVIKYNGFGGNIPMAYKPIRVDREMPCVLRIWRKMY